MVKETGGVLYATDFAEEIQALHAALGISPDYHELVGLPLHAEPSELSDAGPDMFGRPQQLTPQALAAWHAMRERAASEGVSLLLVSGFRSVRYQADLIRRKLDGGRSLENILRVNAAPGYSEHHTGRALDIATPGSQPLETSFEDTAAFKWLSESADEFGFTLSYPRGAACAISYEPWHWCYHGDN